MKKQQDKPKLKLERETLVVLQRDEIDKVGGGLGGATVAGTLITKTNACWGGAAALE